MRSKAAEEILVVRHEPGLVAAHHDSVLRLGKT